MATSLLDYLTKPEEDLMVDLPSFGPFLILIFCIVESASGCYGHLVTNMAPFMPFRVILVIE